MDLKIQYTTRSDGAKTALATLGRGPYLVVPPGWVSHLEPPEEDPVSTAFWERLAEQHTLVLWDRHGCGLSDRDRTDFTVEDDVLDMEAVVTALGLERFALFGTSAGGAVSIVYAARHPERVTRLALYGTGAGYQPGSDPQREAGIEAVLALIRAEWELGSKTMADVFFPGGVDLKTLAASARRNRAAATGDMAASLLEGAWQADLRPLLPGIHVPSLVLHRRHDQVAPFQFGRELAALLPNARLVPLEGDIHLAAYGDSESVLRPLLEFLAEEEAPAGIAAEALPAKGPLTVLFTDIVGHTEMMQRLGDAKGRAVLREHERITRETLKQHGGAEVKTDGDSFMASFASVSSAVECGVALQRAFAEYSSAGDEPIVVRIGLNVGEPIEEEGDYFGSAVILGARIKDQAGGGEILVPEAVRHLLAGKDFLFADRGETALRGFEDPVRLYEVRWTE